MSEDNGGIAVVEKSNHGGKRKDAGRKKTKSDNVAVKINREIARYAQSIAKFRDMDLVDYLNGVLKAPVMRDAKAMAKQIDEKGAEF